MALPSWFQKNPAVAGGIAVVLICVSIGFVVMRPGKPKHIGSNQAYYVDLSTGNLFEAPAATPPIDVPGGAAGKGVLAHVFSCGSCDKADRQVAYIQTLSDEAHAAQKATPPTTAPEMEKLRAAMDRGRLVAKAPAAGESPRWVMEMSPDGQKVMTASLPTCPQGAAKQCFP